MERTKWGRVSRMQSTVLAFDNNDDARENQDVGLDGLKTSEDLTFN